MLQCRVNFLDDTYYVWELERNAVGQDLFSKVCEHLDLLERDYYGLAMWDSPNTRVWLDCAKEIRKQIKGPVAEFIFNIKFYPPDPSILAEDITSYLLCLQLRKDIVIGRLPCPSDILALLGSYTVQSTLGDYDPNLHRNNYISDLILAPNQSEELEQRVIELHSTHRSMSPAQADVLFLEYAKTLPMYGVDLHPAKDDSGADVMLGVCPEGLIVYEDEIKINSFSWPRVIKISHKRNNFILKIRPSEDDCDGDVSFTLPSYRACKQLWKCSVENHSFFRNRLQDTKAKRFLTLGSRFRYHGRTQSECQEASSNITRAPPQFPRFAIKRKANEEILKVLKQPVRTELDDWFLVHDSDKWDISTADDVMLESKQLWESKQQADDWFVLLDCSQFSPSGLQQAIQTEEEKKREMEIVEENMSEEKTADGLVIKRSYNVQMAQEGPVDLEVMEGLAWEILEKEHPELKEQIMGQMKESVTEEILQVNGQRVQRVVISKQWAQESNTLMESQEDGERKTESLETMKRRVVVSEGSELLSMGSEETSEILESLERQLQEVEAIEQKLVDIEVLRVGIQEVESLEQRLQQAEKKGLQQVEETDDWYILLDRSPSMFTTAPTAAQEEWQQVDIPKQVERNDDWYILLEMLPQTTGLSAPTTDVISIPGADQAEEESKEVEIKIQQELLPQEKPKTQTWEEASVELYEDTRVIQSSLRVVKEQKELQEQVKVEYRRPQPVLLEQRAEQPQRDVEDDWFIILDVSPKTSVSLEYAQPREATVELYDEIREDALRSKVIREEQEQQEQMTVEDRRPQPITLEQRAAQPQRDIEDDWYIMFDVSSKGSVPLAYPYLRSTTAEMYESRDESQGRARTEKVEYKQQEQVTLEDRSQQPQRDREDWSIILDVSPKEGVPIAVKMYEESREEVFQGSVRRQEVMEVMTMSPGQTVISEEKRLSFVQTPMYPVVPREVDDDWFQLFDQVPYEQRRSLPVSTAVGLYEESREEMLQRQVRRQEQVVEVMEVMTVSPGQTVISEEKRLSVVQTPMYPVVPREVDDDWFQLFDQVPYEQRSSLPVPTAVGLYEESRDEMLQRRVRRQEQVVEVMEVKTVSPGQTVISEKTMRVVQTPQEFPVGLREIDDDWFQMFDPVPYEERSVPSDIKIRDVEVHEPTKDQRVQRIVERVVEEQMRGAIVTTEERRVIIEERRERVDIMQKEFPVGVREVDDNWFELFDPTPFEKRDVPTVATQVQKIQEQKDGRVRQQERRVRDDVEIRMRQQEIRKQEMEVRRTPPAVIVQTAVQTQREVEDDWFVLFDVSPKQTVVADVVKVDMRAEEVRRREEERRREQMRMREEYRIREEEMRREEERRKQVKVEEMLWKAAIPEKRPAWIQREVEDDWYTLMGVTSKEVPTPVISPVALPKPRPQFPIDQPLTSTPTIQSVSTTKTIYQDRTRDSLDITLESETEESMLIRTSQRWKKRIEGESIYVRHSILMLEDFDVTQEVILRHHASISELKRVFMGGMQEFGPTEWDRRLSSYSPAPKPQLPHANGEILIGMGLIEQGKTVL